MMTVAAAPAPAAISNEDLAKLAQNPVARMISLPFQNNTNLHYGPQAGTQNILNIQPVIPVPLTHDWNLITRTVMPVMWMPPLGPERDGTIGIGDTTVTAFLSPAKPGRMVWGALIIIPATLGDIRPSRLNKNTRLRRKSPATPAALAGSGSQATLPPPSPLRTVLATFTAHGSSLDKPQ
jgi:hypothetical protein